MVSDWIQIRSELPSDVRVLRIAAAVRQPKAAVIGALVMLWAMADRQTTDGFLEGMTPDALDAETGIRGFSDACRQAEWLEVSEEGLSVPRFEKYNGRTSKVRAMGAARAKAQRERNAGTSGAPAPKPAPKIAPKPDDERTPSAPEAHAERDARVTRGARGALRSAHEKRTRSALEAHGPRTQHSILKKDPPSEAAPPRPPLAARQSGSGSRVPGSGEQAEKPGAAAAAAAGSDRGPEPAAASDLASGDPRRHPTEFSTGDARRLWKAAKWISAASSKDTMCLRDVCREVELAAERGEIELLPGERYVEFLIRRAEAYGRSDRCRKFPTTLERWLRDGMWRQPDEAWADSRKAGEGTDPDRVRAWALEEARSRETRERSLAAAAVSPEEAAALIARSRAAMARRNGNGLQPEPAALEGVSS